MTLPVRGLRVRTMPADETHVDADPQTLALLQLRELQVQRVLRHEELMRCLGEIREALGQVPQRVQDNLEQIAALTTEIGLTVAGEVVGEALARGLVDPTPIVKRCLDGAVVGLTDPQVEVALNPEDLPLVVDELDNDAELQGRIPSVTFAPNPGLPRGAVQVQTAAGRSTYQPAEVLERIATELRQEMQASEAEA